MTTITPAGHQQAIANKAHTAEPKSELEKRLEEWKDNHANPLVEDETYSSAQALLTDLSFSVTELHEAILNAPYDPYTGIFLSAGYAQSRERLIVYDLDLQLDHLGYELPRNKTLVNRICAGYGLGRNADGLVVNLGNAKTGAGLHTRGVMINCGHIEYIFGLGASGVMVNAGTCTEFGRSKGLNIALKAPDRYKNPFEKGKLVYHDEVPHDLQEYLHTLIERCNNPESIPQHCGTTPAATIESSIRKIMGKEKLLQWLGAPR